MPNNNETKTDSTHSEQVPSVIEVAETNDQCKSDVQAKPEDTSNWFGSVFGAVSASASAVGNAAASAGSAVVDTASAVGNVAASAGSAIVDTASAVGNAAASAVGNAAASAGSAIVDTASAVGNAAASAGSAIVDTASAMGNAAASAGSAAMQVPNFLGSSIGLISQSPILKKLTEKFKIDWLVNAIDAVDVVNAEAQVRELQRQYPHEKPQEIAHHLMVEKALLAAGTGLASSLVPGVALALAGMDLAAMTALSAELVYQIAAAYGMDLRSSDRKKEVVAIFGLSLGSNLAIEAGVTLVSNIPLAGAVINASASAAMIYAMGYGACRFYEAHLDSSKIETKLEDLREVLQAESEQYLEKAIAQETVMDWILVYVVYASKKFTRWDELLPELQAANLNPRTLAEIEAVTNKSKLLPKLDILLEQLELDFAEPLLKRCTEIIEADGEINEQEGKILLTIQRAVLSKRKQAKKQAQPTLIQDAVSTPTEAQTEVQAASQTPSLSSDSSTNKLSSSMLQNFKKILKVATILDLPKIAELIDAESQTSSRSSHSASAKLSAILLKKFKQILAGSTRLEVPEIGYLIDQVDRMTGEEFEEFLACCFRNLGYAVEMTPKTGDFGADLILSKARKKTVVQAKRYQGKVGNSAVQEVVSAVKYYGAQDAIAITNSEFTSNAHKLAQANGVQLWGREQLIDLVIRAKK
ncbi:restriction endonuclease [Microcoleus sp. bin38.metabat.b11b12b14.051]|uniref:restriction endonuclease n=1 Tax=Microcoleus sp. bin38.metabat.b11b12b14.051 TaxID=2742709 RepID=UPI0025D20E54|nr:restriction endonuclease [Microcoleus sp. bin38.metabat.b11b12b14.051]